MGEAVDFRVLGALDLRHGGMAVELGTPKQRTILALLLLSPGRPVTVTRMVDELWPGEAPHSAVANVITYVSRLRRILAGVGCALTRRDSAYVLETSAETIDFHRFAGLTGRAETALRAGDLTESARLWASALDIWRGKPFEGVATGPELEAASAGWQEWRLTAFESHAQVRLRLHDTGDLIATLLAHTRAEPLRETGWLLLMEALRAGGNSAAALQAYEQARLALAEQLGTDPGQRLRALHQEILTDDGRAPVVPAQLPFDGYGFVGRRGELRQLDTALSRGHSQPTAVLITAIAGMAGVGKTALAVHWAHRVSGEFPDGQLYVNLAGFTTSGCPVQPGDALKGFLDALDVPADRVPSDVDGRAALYRTLLAKRRMLIVLDNAASAEQVRPLLPGTPGCLVVVTSRSQLPGLLAAAGAEPLMLGLLSVSEARQMLAERLGAGRVIAEPQAAGEIIDRCVRLPLALAIVAARAAIRPAASLALLAAQLREAGAGLDPFEAGDAATDVRAVFASSYRTLPPLQARLFRLLGLHSGPDIGVAAAASLAALPLAQTSRLLGELAQAHLVTEPAAGRYGMHDLLRTFAGETAAATDAPSERHDALRRLYDHYLHACESGATAINPLRVAVADHDPLPAVVLFEFTSAADALAWFRDEHAALIACVHRAAAVGLPAHAIRLAGALATYFDRRGHWSDWVSTQQAAIEAARAAGDRIGQAHAHRRLARALTRMSRLAEAHAQALAALELFTHEADCRGQANTQLDLALLLEQQGRFAEALGYAQAALSVFRRGDDDAAKANALNSVGWAYSLVGDHRKALIHCQEALEVLRGLDNRDSEAHTWDSIGYAHHHLGEHDEAVACYLVALELFRELGDRFYEARILVHLGEARHAAGQHGEAALMEALSILDDLGHPTAAEVRGKLEAARGDRSRAIVGLPLLRQRPMA
ncbi:SARP family transcriptional regulator [Rhizocola hellebori]|uniref:SARP family transcriptional regulator n=1 Tax=Rhizocola hellebori TaxID=1392758 RepID=A0A8J3Q9I2_9ACTN|nr:BTAD domain-containing putative transcriptional regulator [Rhizocola hellebori]GIH06420.1 SARP family transcriptional regulator [Rhizocola hellebori]